MPKSSLWGVMMSKKSKKDNRKRRPPLSLLDKSIYLTGLFLSFILSLLFAFCFEDITGIIAFQDSSVVAYNSHASFLFALPFLFYVEISALVFCIVSLEDKKPVFGNRKIQYGETPWAKDCFPLFDSRRKKIYIKPSKKRFHRHMIILWFVGLLLCSLIAPLGFFCRDCLTHNNSIVTYNMLNQEELAPYTPEDYSHLNIQAKYVSGYRMADYWKYEITIRMKDGKSFTFSNRDFNWREPNCQERCLKKMLDIKTFFTPDAITIKEKHSIDKVADYLGMNDEQKQLLQELFS